MSCSINQDWGKRYGIYFILTYYVPYIGRQCNLISAPILIIIMLECFHPRFVIVFSYVRIVYLLIFLLVNFLILWIWITELYKWIYTNKIRKMCRGHLLTIISNSPTPADAGKIAVKREEKKKKLTSKEHGATLCRLYWSCPLVSGN